MQDFFVIVIFVLDVILQSTCVPIRSSTSASILPVDSSTPASAPVKALKFMQTFGYLEKGTSDSEALFSEDAVREAVKTMQHFGAIPQTGVIDNATLKLMESPRCGVPDVLRHTEKQRVKRFVIGGGGWKKRHISYFVANWSPKVGQETVGREMQRALDAWGRYSRLTFHPIHDPNADIIVAFGRGPHGDGYPFDGPGNILAHAYFPYEMGSYGGDIHFDDDEDWKVRPGEYEDGVDFFTVAVHELGHSLGLAHSPVSESIMFPYYKGHQPNFQLGYDDILAMYDLYISRQLEEDYGQYNSTAGSWDDQPDTRTDEHEVDERHEDDDRHNPDDENDREDDDEESNDIPPHHDDEIEVNDDTTHVPSYEGDYETVDEHLDHERKHGIPRTTPYGPTRTTVPPAADICEGNYDAISMIRGELFVFKREYLWRLSKRGQIGQGYPVRFTRLFTLLPESIHKIDAVYERGTDSSIVFLTGKEYWAFDGHKLTDNSPRPLTELGLPSSLQNVDAAFVWAKNGKTYFLSGSQYWRYNETTRRMDEGYPQDLSRWRGVPHDPDAAMTWEDGMTYFFKGSLFWRFDNTYIKTEDKYPLPAPDHWFGCSQSSTTVRG